MKKTFLICAFILAGCGETAPTTVSTDDFHLWDENEFTISVPAGYERIMPGQADLTLPQDFVAGYSEVRLDDNFATTVTIHRESLQADITSETYALALHDATTNATDYTELSFEADKDGFIHRFQTSMASSSDAVTFTQKALVHNSRGWLISCASTAETDPCPEIIQSFIFK